MSGRWRSIAKRLRGVRITVLGLPVLDRYIFGVTQRISREAPVLIVREESVSHALGGAGNTATNLAGLGALPHLVGPIGDDPEGAIIERLCRQQGVEVGLVRGASPVSVTKTRILAGGLNTSRQQMLRVDREDDGPPSEAARAALAEAAQRALEATDGVIISDYGDGALAEVWKLAGQTARARNLPVVVDSRHALLRFDGVTAVTPNEPEAETALERPLRTSAEAEAAAVELCDRLHLEAALLTRGREGMILAPSGQAPVSIAAIGGEAVDVTGAGDTVAATFTAALAAGADAQTAAELANLAASVVVQRRGTVPISAVQLLQAIEEEGDPK